MNKRGLAPRSPKHNGNADDTDCCSQPIVSIRRFFINEPSPKNSQYNKNTAVGSIHPSEGREALHGGDDAVCDKNEAPDNAKPKRP